MRRAAATVDIQSVRRRMDGSRHRSQRVEYALGDKKGGPVRTIKPDFKTAEGNFGEGNAEDLKDM